MKLPLTDIKVPLREEPEGTYRIGQSRVTLDVMMNAYKMGDSPEQIVDSFDVLKLSDVYLVIGFYLQNKEVVEAYLKEGEEQAAHWKQHFEKIYPNKGLREKLLQRMEARHALLNQPT